MEREWLEALRERLVPRPPVTIGVGDDAAAIQCRADEELIVTTDLLSDGVDFVVGAVSSERIGHKALAVNLSDLAAMGARPVAAFVSLCLPHAGARELAEGLYAGLLPLAERFDCQIAGGDTNSWPGKLTISVTALGVVPAGAAWKRSGARPGDWLLATGSFGGSLLGRHLDVQPRVREALALRELLQVRAAMDVSDGLSLDAARLADPSRCGIALDLDRIPISPDAERAAASDATRGSPLDRALSDGEDFELLLAVAPQEAAAFLAERSDILGTPLRKIGEFVAEAGLWSVSHDAPMLVPLVPRGWEHGGASEGSDA
ncbi:MAG TPA: thiamine-phosphate kinase [Pirellulaceae bacterium]|jgi:thiamine-monophosphate kinase|nr:thiamine-phosphate kinase [Pirellulaceae bacterium]